MTPSPRLAKVTAVIALALLTAACLHRGERHDYRTVEKPFAWGGVRVGMTPKTSYYRDGVSMMKGSYGFFVAVWLKDGPALPPTCKVRFQSAVLLDAAGKAVATLAPQEATPRIPLVGLPSRPNPDGRAYASLPHEVFDIPHVDYLGAIDFQLDGCGAIDGAYRVREVIGAQSEKRLFNPVWSALMGV